MNSFTKSDSLFDRHNKMECPTASFGWVLPPPSFKYSKSDVIYSGVLQEIDDTTSTIRSSKPYAATPQRILRFAVRAPPLNRV